MSPSVTETLDALDLLKEDTAATRLVRRYAAAIDEAAQIVAELADVDAGGDSGAWAKIRSLSAKVEAQEVLAKLGPKLLDALESLGATPRARGQKAGGGVAASRGGLAALRAARSA